MPFHLGEAFFINVFLQMGKSNAVKVIFADAITPFRDKIIISKLLVSG